MVAFYKKSKDNMNIGDISEQSYLGKCRPNPEVLVWQPNGWRLAKYIRVKVLKKQISVRRILYSYFNSYAYLSYNANFALKTKSAKVDS